MMQLTEAQQGKMVVDQKLRVFEGEIITLKSDNEKLKEMKPSASTTVETKPQGAVLETMLQNLIEAQKKIDEVDDASEEISSEALPWSAGSVTPTPDSGSGE